MTESGPIGADILERVTHGYADNGGVKIHYATLGQGPLVVMIHGFPDFWYTWRHQMAALAPHFQVVAIDQRGYNESDKPKGGEHYAMPHLVGDVAAVVRHFGQERAVIVGHDWGGAVAWQTAIHLPAIVDRLIVLNLPHLRGLTRELAHNPKQRESSQYARNFQQEGAHTQVQREWLLSWITDPADRERHAEALDRSDMEALLHYYKQNYPREPYTEDTSPVVKVQAPVLLMHGLDDWALLPGALNNTWEWVERDLTLVTLPGAGHFIQHDAAEFVSRTMLRWLKDA
ncbi:MAG TPA: alpha/beta hydrolase [Roseiflexaceae bacterium]|nr:alpha/beta hydrolase [Roseiflexaceae bacterium]